ncbi:probable LRR receptor-like serine/threonine-protein kinase At4g36180 [Lathyrus oleraceus]|nr:probable LRR receptor-like serine/threonine-protein kinase At4g36180 [Pisum sativum]
MIKDIPGISCFEDMPAKFAALPKEALYSTQKEGEVVTEERNQDRASLLTFKASIFKDTTDTLSSWISRDCCDGGWEGVQCDASTGRVNMLQIQSPDVKDSGSFMKSTLSPALGNIPDQIGNLKSLTSLQLSGNQLTRHFPLSISKLQKLWYLNVSRNGLSDPLPAIPVKGIPSLLSIDLSYNILSLGSVPDWIRSKELRDVHLAGCKLKGDLPHFVRPDTLSSIDLSDNFLVDGISNFFTNMSSLQDVKLSNNQLRFDISKIKLPFGLASIDLHANHLMGSLSSSINNMTSSSLEVIDVSNNFISGHIPEFVEGSSLKVLNLGSNNLSGSIPVSISNLVELERLDISRNNILGNIPSSLGQLQNLQWLDVSINGITGQIPGSFSQITSLKHANFRTNRLCGEIPTE